MITLEEFQVAITALQQLMPMGKPLSPPALVLAWDTFPPAAKNQLTSESLDFAVRQRVMDPDPPKEQALHIALLRYVFPIKRTVKRERGQDVNCDEVLLEGGPRADLAQRMANPNRWHETAPASYGQPSASERPRLPGGGRQWHPSQMTAERHAAHLRGVAAAMQRLRDGGGLPRDGGWRTRGWRPDDSRLAKGRWWFQRCLDGFWPLESDDAGIAVVWIMANGRLADDLLEQAQSAPGRPPSAEEVVAGVSLQGVNPWR